MKLEDILKSFPEELQRKLILSPLKERYKILRELRIKRQESVIKNLELKHAIDTSIDNQEFILAHDLIAETNQSFFLTGKAGTGKSSFIKRIIKTIPKNFVIVAPTGIAAINIGGVTIHSFFQFPLRPILPDDDGIKLFRKESEKRKVISDMDVLIIDEISMVRADLIDGIDYSLRQNGGNPCLPFGGKQVVFVGDIFQLEPIALKNSGEYGIISDIYESHYFYKAKVFDRIKLFTVELTKVYRQNDPLFINLLDKVRINKISQSDIDKFNDRVIDNSENKEKNFTITLTTKNESADAINSKKLSEIRTRPFSFKAEISGDFDESKFPTESELILKEGAQVIFIKNDSDKRWVNGTIGQIHELSETTIKVKLENGSTYFVEERVWENIKYKYDKKTKRIKQEIIGTFKQYPLKLAWAITIHKSQGLSFERVIIDFGNGTFASGQAYVALSRAVTFDGLFLKKRIKKSDIYIDEEIKSFSNTFNDITVIKYRLKEGKEIFPYVRYKYWEKIGKLYFQKAIKDLIINKFDDAYDNLVYGYDYISCDCETGGWFNKEVIDIYLKANNFDCNAYKLEFIKAFLFFYSRKYNYAFNSINCFIELQPNNELGYYLKGRILIGLDKPNEALKSFQKSLELKRTSRTLYRIGRTKEQYLKVYGLDEMYEAIVINPSSSCVNWHFANYALERKIFPEEQIQYKNISYKSGLSTCLLGIRIEEEVAKSGVQGIKDYLIFLEKAMSQIGSKEKKLFNEYNELQEDNEGYFENDFEYDNFYYENNGEDLSIVD